MTSKIGERARCPTTMQRAALIADGGEAPKRAVEAMSTVAFPQVLIPYNSREAVSLRDAAKLAGRSESTLRTWCALYHIGRRVVGGPWAISKVALAMLLDDNESALNAYLAGDRTGPLVAPYFARLEGQRS